MSDLERATAEVYRVFAGYALPEHSAGCDHCVDAADEVALRTKGLRELSGDDLYLVVSNLGLTWGGVAELKYLLPRIFELAGPDWIDVEMLFARLRYCGWHEWPPEERAAVHDWLVATWRDTIERAPGAVRVDEVLCGIGQAERDLGPFLAAWLAHGTASSWALFAGFLELNAEALRGGRLWNAFWEEQATAAQVIAWLFAPATLLALEAAAARFGGEPVAGDLRAAYETLCVLHGAVH